MPGIYVVGASPSLTVTKRLGVLYGFGTKNTLILCFEKKRGLNPQLRRYRVTETLALFFRRPRLSENAKMCGGRCGG